VLKLFFDWCPTDWIQREVEIGHFISATSLPTPEIIDTVSLDGRQGIIYERVDGPSMVRLALAKPWLVTSLARQFADLHDRIHRQSGSGLIPLRTFLKTTIAGVEILPVQVKEEVLNLLDRLPDGTALCHFDFHPGQVMLTSSGPKIVDWMTGLQGEPLADVARTSVLLTFGEIPDTNWPMRSMLNLLRGMFGRRYLDRYRELRPSASKDQIKAWMIPVAAARLKEGIRGEEQPIMDFIRRSLVRSSSSGVV